METLPACKEKFSAEMLRLQDSITREMRALDPMLQLQEDPWQRKDAKGAPGGGGLTRAFQGEVFENAGVNTSTISGAADPNFLRSLVAQFPARGDRREITDGTLWASGLSLIIHPKNPKVPSVHANFRMIHAHVKDTDESFYWFGGGADLTPFYPYEEDFVHFHRTWKRGADTFGKYQQMKKTCDEYFVNIHRDREMRGIGGIFFDHHQSGRPEEDTNFVMELSQSFIPSYFPLVERRKDEGWDAEDEDFQLHRRGRYVEFNLLYDRGTAFGLRTNGRTDSILISLPARCKYTYRYAPKKGSPHEKMMAYYYPRDWV